MVSGMDYFADIKSYLLDNVLVRLVKEIIIIFSTLKKSFYYFENNA